MANFLEGLGRTNTLRAVTGDIANLAVNMRSQGQRDRALDLDDRRLAITEADAAMKRQAFNEERQMLQKPIPIDGIKQAFPVPAAAEYAQKLATTLGMVEEIDGVPVIRAGNAREIYGLMQQGDHPKILSNLATQHYRQQVGTLKEQLGQYQQKNAGKDLSQDKQYLAMTQGLKQAQSQLVSTLEQSDKLNQYYDLIEKGYTPENVQKYMETGDMASLGEPSIAGGSYQTDIDDFVNRANEESIRTTGEPLTPGQQNEMALRFKRAQAEEAGGVTAAKESAKTEAAGEQAEVTATGKGMGEINMEQYKTATTAVGQIEDIDRLINHIDTSKAITGMGAEVLKNIERAKTLLGSKAAAGKVADTELLDTMMGSEVFPMIKSLGIGARGMDTPAEREFMRQVLTGSLQLNKVTLRKMAEIRKNLAERSIKRWNSRTEKGELDRFYEATGLSKEKIEYGSAAGLVEVVSPDGQTITFPDAASAEAFKKAAGI